MTTEQKYVIIANAHIRAYQRVKAKQEAKAKIRSLIKPFEAKQVKESA